MSPIVVNDPTSLPWQTNLFDILMVAVFVSIVAYAVVEFRAGKRIYAAVLTAAVIYGLILELAGMATLNMYQQGRFLIMINWTVIPLWKGTTMMPLYVVIFYPVILVTGFKIIEALGIRSNWQAAITGGLFMVALDAPYIVEGNLRNIVWWTWDPDFKLFQFVAGWPMIDLCWQGIWDALFFYIVLRALPHIDPRGQAPAALWSNRKALGIFPVTTAISVLIIGPVLLLPLCAVTFLGGPQWAFVVVLLLAYGAVAAVALRRAQPARSIEPFTFALASVYVGSFVAMIISSMWREGGVTGYIVVQLIGVVGIGVFVCIPLVKSRSAPTSVPVRPAERVAVDGPG